MRLWEAGAGEAAVHLQGRQQLLRHVAEKLRPRGLTVTDDMIHLRPGAASPFEGARYDVMVDQYGLFGFADDFSAAEVTPEVDKAFDVPTAPPPKPD